MKKRILTLLLAMTLFAASCLTGCAAGPATTEPSESSTRESTEPATAEPAEPATTEPLSPAEQDEVTTLLTDFAVRLFRKTLEDDQNTLVSPLSVILALAMTANGAEGTTLSEFESLLGASVDDLNRILKAFSDALPESTDSGLFPANSIWVNDIEGFEISDEFIRTNETYYGADVFKLLFNEEACAKINSWCAEKTHSMIPSILDEIPPGVVTYLINALAFEAKWAKPYSVSDVWKDVFTKEDGETETVEFMHSEENTYLSDENAKGFIKYYEGRGYAFAALLPDEGVSVSDYVASLTGEKLNAILANPVQTEVQAAVPKFETAYEKELSNVLKEMGLEKAFDRETAEFDALSASTDGRIFIGRVLHKTFISVAEEGTRAGAVTAVELKNESLPLEQPKRVYLDRPFVYMLIECETNAPFFIGVLRSIGG